MKSKILKSLFFVLIIFAPQAVPVKDLVNSNSGFSGRLQGGAFFVQTASQLLATDTATPEDINAKLAALRQAREALKQELTQARAQLQQTLTVKQEATFVLTGILE